MFCEKCQRSSFHKGECGLKVSDRCGLNGLVMSEIRIILKVAALFASANELMDFVERTIKSDVNEIPGNF